MKIIEDILHSTDKIQDTYIAIGAFDGIHMGHRKLIEEAVRKSKETGGKSVVFTFCNHPMELINKEKAPKLINTLEEKIYLMGSLGVDYLVLQHFDEKFAEITPKEFVEKILKDKLNAKEIFVGFNFSFGRGGEGRVEELKKLGEENKIKINITEPVKSGDKVISSTYIRNLLKNGDLEKANMCLESPFFVLGEVVHGRKLGRVMGFPTANIEILDKVYPPFGIYGGKVKILGEDEIYNAVINIGKNPTLKPGEKSIEVHILDFDREIYGQKINVSLIEHLRDEKKFSSMDELKETIKKDVENWREKIKEV